MHTSTTTISTTQRIFFTPAPLFESTSYALVLGTLLGQNQTAFLVFLGDDKGLNGVADLHGHRERVAQHAAKHGGKAVRHHHLTGVFTFRHVARHASDLL